METKRTYGERCGAAHAMDLIGERWALLVVRELLLGPKRFTDLREGIPNAGPNVLSQRLRELEASGVVRRRTLPPPAASQVYELTEWGHELGPALLALGRWGARSPAIPRDVEIGLDSMVLALMALFESSRAAGIETTIGFTLRGQEFDARVDAEGIRIVRGAPEEPDATLATDPDTLSRLVWQGLDLEEAVAAGSASFEGDRAALERFLGLFPPPVPASAA